MALSTTGPGDSVQGKADVSLAAWQARRQGQDSRQHLRDPSQHLCPTRAGARKRAASLRGSNVLKFSSCTLSSVLRSTIPSPLSHSKPAPDSRLAFESKLCFFSSSDCSHEWYGVCTYADCSRKRKSCCYLKLIPLSLLVYSVLSLGVFFPHSAEISSCESRSHLRQTNSKKKGSSVTSKRRKNTSEGSQPSKSRNSAFFQSMAQVGMATWTFSAVSHTHGWVWGRK